MLTSEYQQPLLSMTRRVAEDQIVPLEPERETNRQEQPSILFRIHRNSILISTVQLQSEIHEEVYLYGSASAIWIRISVGDSYFLLKRYRFPENQVKQEIIDQIFMGMFNPSVINLENIQEQYGKIVTFDQIQDHPNVIKIIGFVTSTEVITVQMEIYAVLMEFPPQGTLFHFIQLVTASVEQILLWTYQIAKALKYFHSVHKIIHGNVTVMSCYLFNDGKYLKMGVPKYISKPHQKLFTPSPDELRLAPPETMVLTDDGKMMLNLRLHGFTSDIWQLATLLYNIYYKKRPFAELEVTELNNLKSQIENGKRPELDSEMDKVLKSVIEASWRTEKRGANDEILPLEPRRPTAAEILTYLDYN